MAQEKKEPQKKRTKRKKRKVIEDVTVDEKVIQSFDIIYKNTLRFAIFRLNEKETKIILDSISTKEDTLESLKEQLPANDVRWIICSLSYKVKDKSQRKKVLFISWIPDSIKRESHRETIRIKSLGIFHQTHLMRAFRDKTMNQIQANDVDDLEPKRLVRAIAQFGEEIDLNQLNEDEEKEAQTRKNHLIEAVEVDEEVIKYFNKVYTNTLRYAIFKLNESETKISLDSVSNDDKDTLKALKEKLPANDVRWIVASLWYKLADNAQRKKIVFIIWIPDTIMRDTDKGTIRAKSLGIFHAQDLMGIFHDKTMKMIQGNCMEDLNREHLLRKVAKIDEQIDFNSLWM